MSLASLHGRLNQQHMTALGHQIKTFLWSKFAKQYPGDVQTQQAEVELSQFVTALLRKFGVDQEVRLYIRRCSDVSLNMHVMDGLPDEIQMLMPGCPYCVRDKERTNAPKDKSA